MNESPDCRSGFGPTDPSADTDGVLAELEAARNADLACGSPDEQVRICRALFAMTVVDPALYLDDPPLLARTADALDWVLGDAANVADSDLEPALAELRQQNQVIATASDDDAVIEAIAARAVAEVTNPIEAAWDAHCR